MSRSQEFTQPAFVQGVYFLCGDFSFRGKGNRMPLGIYGNERCGDADKNFLDGTLVILSDGGDGGDDRTSERRRVQKSVRRIALVFFTCAAAEYERVVDPFCPDEESDFVRTYIQNGNAFVTHNFRPLRKNNLCKNIFSLLYTIYNALSTD